MSENFSELKRLFDEECEAVKQAIKDIPEHRRYSPATYVLAKLLSGHSIGNAERFLLYASRIIRKSKVNADDIQLPSSSGSK